MADGSAPTRQRAASKARTRAKVLAAARAVFEAKGFAATSTRDIAAHAGLSTGAIYASFSGKDALFTAATGRVAPTAAMSDAAAELLAAAKHLSGLADAIWISGMSNAEAEAMRTGWAALDAAIAKAEGNP